MLHGGLISGNIVNPAYLGGNYTGTGFPGNMILSARGGGTNNIY